MNCVCVCVCVLLFVHTVVYIKGAPVTYWLSPIPHPVPLCRPPLPAFNLHPLARLSAVQSLFSTTDDAVAFKRESGPEGPSVVKVVL